MGTRRRIELDPTLQPVVVPGRVLNELCAHALESRPEECCGLLAGDAEQRFAAVHRCRNEMTLKHRSDPRAFPRDGREAYFMSELDFLRGRMEAEERGGAVTAVYHSHVGAGAYFSEMDQEFAEHVLFPVPDAAHIVLAVWERKVTEVGIFERDPISGFLDGRLVQALEPR
ncbi:MAG: Mov34/MPN/PAD-1 family protein [Myxococcota bacterium]